MLPHTLSHDFVHQLGAHIIMDPFCLESFLVLSVKEFDLLMLSILISSRTVCEIKCSQSFFRPNYNILEWLIRFHTEMYYSHKLK